MQTIVDIAPVQAYLQKGYRILTPGLRLTRQVLKTYVMREQAVSSVVEQPEVQPVDGWLEQCWVRAVETGLLPERLLLNRLQERLLWQQVVTQDRHYGEEFRLLQPTIAAEQARISRDRLLHYAPDEQALSQSLGRGEDPDCATFERWRRAFEQRLGELAVTTRADAYRELLTLAVPNRERVVLFHCLSLTPLVEKAVAHLAEEPVWIGSPRAGESVAPPDSRLSARRFDSRRAELAEVARWAADRHRRQVGSTGVVLMDIKADRPQLEYFLRQAFDCLDARYNRLPVNFATGQPLASTPLFRDALLALTLPYEPLTRQRVMLLLRSPYVLGTDFADSPAGLSLSEAVFELGTDPIDWADWIHCINRCAPASPLAAALSHRAPDATLAGKRSLMEWAEAIRAQLQQWGWPARNALDSMEYQQVGRFEVSLDQLIGLSQTVGAVSYPRALALWQAVLEDTVFQPKTESTDLQVMGPQEALGLCFDALWVVGLQAGTLPPRPRLLPFIPGALQRSWLMPEANAEVLHRQARVVLASWQATHGEVLGSFYGFDEGVEQMPSSLVSVIDTVPPVPLSRPEHWSAPVVLEQVDDSRATPKTPLGTIPFGGGATVLKNQSACPFRAWVTHRLGPQALAPVTLGLTPAERGSIVHDALYVIWGELQSRQGLREISASALNDLIARAVTSGLQTLEQRAGRKQQSVRKRVGSGCLDVEHARCRALLGEWLTLESKRDGEFDVVEREQEHTLVIGPLTLRLRPDRVDALEDGRRVVVDYKTGTVTRSAWLGARPADPQLPLYTLIDDRVMGLTFAKVKRGDTAFVFLGEHLGFSSRDKGLAAQLQSSGADPVNWSALTQEWRANLTDLADAFGAGEAAVDPRPNACTYCELGSVCRIGDAAQIDAKPVEVTS